MTRFLISLALLFVLMAATAAAQVEDFHIISQKELQLLVGDLAKSNPDVIKRIADDPSLKAKQLDKLRELLAFASQAQRDGLADDPATKQELANIKAEVISAEYDKKINEGKPVKPPLSYITDAQVKLFWSEDPTAKEADFQKFLSAKVEFIRRQDPQMASYTPSDEDKTLAHDIYAKSRIYEKDYLEKAKNGTLDAEFQQRTNLQLKLQHAQFLARLYADKNVGKMDPTDVEIKTYISQRPELDPAPKKLVAQGILERAKRGEDFAALANKYTEDPGNKNEKGELQGGLYKDVRVGIMVPMFEKAALALQPGQISPELVESDFGYHIIKLEKKTETKDANGTAKLVYDVRHILIGTMYEDPTVPGSGPTPLKLYVRQKLANEKQKKMIDELVMANKVSVPSDYTLPGLAKTKPTAAAKPATKRTTPVQKKPHGKR
jgi:hypothetical protein